MIGIGVDIEEPKRFQNIRYLKRCLDFFLTPAEQAAAGGHPDKFSYYASRFALKEAVIKAYPGKIGYLDLEISKIGDKPIVSLKNNAGFKVHVSLAHSQNYAVGFASIE